MRRITVDAELRTKLLGLRDSLELRDESGKLLARLHLRHDSSASSRGRIDGLSRIIVDAALRAKLADCAEPLELCDESGHVLATVWPHYDPSDYEDLEPQISREELDRRLRDKSKGYTTEEVLAYLERLSSS